ncbi:hypothetical protein BO226_19370 [Rhodococcus sp. 2G]|uniref:hypothetical protein n=1 Tax=Rhodococcus sp. 2G TaxID=1570939 RepID=UPI000903CA9E|nr:hypothetical protein [Rhodococcus sp. 2G]APE11035.1 hypothetical protein BO226_19040 [Rhodococcus sp. 2G]APE11091.1 hypothetical protein BO226_19370 [Rhodococcus sp. 2G]
MKNPDKARAREVRISGQLAETIAAHAVRAIGPQGTVLKVTDEADASLIRATFIARLAETATKLANGEPLK